MSRSRWITTVASLVLAATASSACGGEDSPDPARPVVAVTVGSPRALLDGLQVPTGAERQGPVLVRRQVRKRPTEWLAVMSVTAEPSTVWKAMSRQLADRFPDEEIKPGELSGCRIDPDKRFDCEIDIDTRDRATGESVTTIAKLLNPADDVTGRYVLVVMVMRDRLPYTDVYSKRRPRWTGGSFPAVRPARRAPAVRQPLAPSRLKDRYVLLPGSALVTQWGTGSLTGGFDVLLTVLPGLRARQVGAAYARQSAQFSGRTKITRSRVGEATVTRFAPPGGAGGYQADIFAVDQPRGRDYVYYSLYND